MPLHPPGVSSKLSADDSTRGRAILFCIPCEVTPELREDVTVTGTRCALPPCYTLHPPSLAALLALTRYIWKEQLAHLNSSVCTHLQPAGLLSSEGLPIPYILLPIFCFLDVFLTKSYHSSKEGSCKLP